MANEIFTAGETSSTLNAPTMTERKVSDVPSLADIPATLPTLAETNAALAPKPKTVLDKIDAMNAERKGHGLAPQAMGGAALSKLEALNQIADRYSDALTRIGSGEEIKGIDLDVAKGIRKDFFGDEKGGKEWKSKIPQQDLAVFLAVRSGQLEPTEKTLPYIIQSLTAVASGGNVLGDFEGKRFMQFQSRTDNEKHVMKEGMKDWNTDKTAVERSWTPQAVFDALQKHFDVMEESAADRLVTFNRKLLQKNCGLKDGENFFNLSHQRKFDIANNLSGIFDREWITTRIEAGLQRFAGEGYQNLELVDNGNVAFERAMSGDGFGKSAQDYITGFKSAVASGEYYQSPSEFARYLVNNPVEHSQIEQTGSIAVPLGANGIGSVSGYGTRYWKDSELTDGDEKFRGVKNADGSYSLQIERGGRVDRETMFTRQVIGKYEDMDGKYAAAAAIAALNENPEAWTIVNRALDRQGTAIMTNGLDGKGLLQDIYDLYDKYNDDLYHDKARAIANSALTALEAVDYRVGAYGENAVGRVVAGGLNIGSGVAKSTMDYFRPSFSDVADDFMAKQKAKYGGDDRYVKYGPLADNAGKDAGNVMNDFVFGLDKYFDVTKGFEDKATDAASRFVVDKVAVAEAYAETYRTSVYRLNEKRIFDDGTAIGGGLQMFADIYALGKFFETGGALLGAGLELTGKGAYAAGVAVKGAKYIPDIRKGGIVAMRLGRAMVGAKNLRLVNETKKFNSEIKAIRKAKNMTLETKAAKIAEMNDAFLQSVAKKYGANPVEISKFTDELARFVGKFPALGFMYNHDVDRSYAEMLADTKTLEDLEFTEEEKEQLTNYARERGATTAILMSGLAHYAPKAFNKVMKSLGGEMGAEADALDKLFLKIVKGEAGYGLKPEQEFLYKACLTSAFSRAAKDFATNGAFIFTMEEANAIIDNNRRIWEKQQLDPNYKPTVYDRLRGTGDALWEASKVGLQMAAPTGIIGGVAGVRRAKTTKIDGKIIDVKASIRNSRYDLVERELQGDGRMSKAEAADIISKALIGLDEARRNGDAGAVDGIYADIRKAGGAKAAVFFRQLESAILRRVGSSNIGLATGLELMRPQETSVDALKKSMDMVGYGRGTNVEDIGDGRFLVTLDPSQYGDVKAGKMKFVVTRGAIPLHDGKGNWSRTFVDSVVKQLESGELVGRVKRMWDALTPAQKRKARGYTDDNGKYHAPHNIKGIWEEAAKGINNKGVFLNKDAAAKYGLFGGNDVNLYDGIVVLSEGMRGFESAIGRTNEMLKSLDNIRKMATKATKDGSADVETFLHEFFHAVTETLPLNSGLRKDLERVYGGRGARGGDWREGFVDSFLGAFSADYIHRQIEDERIREEMDLFSRVGYAASRLLRGLFGRERTEAEKAGAESMRNFIDEAVGNAPSEAKSMREKEEDARRLDERTNEENIKIVDEPLNSLKRVEDDYRLTSFIPEDAVNAAIEIEKEVVDGRRRYDILGGGRISSRNAVEGCNLRDGRNLLVGAHVIANRFGTLEISSPVFGEERERSKQINSEIEQYAKRQGVWVSDFEKAMKTKGATFLGKGSEADVYLSKSKRVVFKAITPDTLYDGDMRLLLERIAIHNYISPDTAMKIIGFGMHKGGLNVIVNQPYFKEGEVTHLTGVGFRSMLKDAGFTQVKGAHIANVGQEGEEVWVSKDRKFVIGDLAPRNVSFGEGNTLRILDMAAFKNTPWLRDRADIPETLRPKGQMTYKEMEDAYYERMNSAMAEFYKNAGFSDADARNHLEGLFQSIGADGLANLCGRTEAERIIFNISNKFFEQYNKDFFRTAFDSEAARTGKDEVQRKKVSFAELNKAAGVQRVKIQTVNGITLDAYAMFGGTGYISSEKYQSKDEIYSLSGISTGDTGIRFVWAGEAARLPIGMLDELQNPKTAKVHRLGEFFWNAKRKSFISNEAQAVFDAYPEQLTDIYGKEAVLPSLDLVQVFVKGSDAYAEYLKQNKQFVSEPWFGNNSDDVGVVRNRFSTKRNMVLVDSLGNIVVHPNASQKQLIAGINEAVIRNIQLREKWEKPVTRNQLRFFRSGVNIEDPFKDVTRHTQLLKIGSGRLRGLVEDVVVEEFNRLRKDPKFNHRNNAWFSKYENEGELRDAIGDTITKAISDCYEYYASEIEAYGLSRSFIDRKRMKAAREEAKESNVPAELQFITESMLDEIGAARDLQDRGLIDGKSVNVPVAERNVRVKDFYKTTITDAVRRMLFGQHSSENFADWVTDRFSERADELFKDYVRAYRDGRAKKAERDVEHTAYDQDRGEAVRITDAADLDSLGGRDAVTDFVYRMFEERGMSATLDALRDTNGKAWKSLEKLAREDLGKDASEQDVKNNMMSAATKALHEWQDANRRNEGLFSLESIRDLRLEQRRLQAMVDRATARRLRLSAIHNAHGLTRMELDKRLGFDSIAVLKRLDDAGRDNLVNLIEENALAYIRSHNPELAKLKPEEFMKDFTVAAEYGATVASWLSNAARSLSFGRTRENAYRDAARIRHYTERPPLELIRGMLRNNIAAISAQMKKYAVDDVIERMRKVIDKDAMGNQSVVVDKELYKRRIEPRLQQYWKKVKEAFTMSEQEVADRMDEISRKYGDFSEALTEIKDGKGSEGVVPTEETLLERDLAQLEYVALQRFGALAEKDLGFVADKVNEVSQDIVLARQRLEVAVGPKMKKFAEDRDALIKGCVDFRRGSKDGMYELGKVASSLRSAMYFNTPDLFLRLKMYFPTDSEAYKVCDELRRDVSIAHIEMEKTIAEYETAMREELPKMFAGKYGKISFEKLMGILHEKNADYEFFSRSGWRIPTEGAEMVDFDTGKTYKSDVAEYVVDVKNAEGKTIHKAGDKVPSTTKLNADGKIVDEIGRVVAEVKHRKGEAIIEKLPKAVSIDDPRNGGTGHNTRLSLADLIYIYAARRQYDMRKNNFIYGCDEAYMKRLEETIGAEGIAVADWLVGQFEKLRGDLTVVSERITGMPVMAPDILYFPLRFEGEPSVGGATRYKIDSFPSFLTRRQNHDRSVLREGVGVFDTFSSRINESAHYMAFADIIERVKATFCDRKVEGAYRELLGDGAFKQVYRQLFETLSGGVRDPIGWFGRLRNFTTATTLFLNVPSAIKQFEGIAAYSSVMGIGHWLANLHHMGRAYGYLSASNAVKSREFKKALEDIGNPFTARKHEGYSDIIASLKDARDKAERGGNTLASNPLTRFYMRNGLSLTTAIDSLASASMGCAFYNEKFSEHRKAGMTVEEARRAAIADLDYAIQTTQQSSRREFLLGPQADTLWGRVVSQFAGPAYIRFGMELEALHRAVYIDKNPKAWKELANKVLALHVVCPTALSLLGFGAQSLCHRADDEEWARKAIRDWCVAMCLGPLSGWFIGGAVAQTGLQTLSNGFLDKDIPVSQLRNGAPMLSKIAELMTRTSNIGRDVMDGLREGDIDTDAIATEVGKLIDALFPVERTVKRAVQNINGM